MTDSFYRPLPVVEIRAVEKVERERAVRAYCAQSGSSWHLQVRAPLLLKTGREGKDFLVATATLDVEDMRALRNALTGLLEDVEAGADEPETMAQLGAQVFNEPKPREPDRLPPQESSREMWLLTPLGSLGRTSIPVKQYEELRALAIKLAHQAQSLRECGAPRHEKKHDAECLLGDAIKPNPSDEPVAEVCDTPSEHGYACRCDNQ